MEVPRLKEWRQRRALGQRDLAAESGVGVSTINRLELGKQLARPSTLRRLATALGVAPADLTEYAAPSQAETGGKDEAR